MKGQQEVISIVLISGILIGVVGSVYFWGVPLIQKNKDIATLEAAENFMETLDNRIKFIANNGGRDQIVINVPAIARYDSTTQTLEMIVDTEGTIYSADIEIPLGRNSLCSLTTGDFGINEADTICVKSSKTGEKKYRTAYTLKYIKLVNNAILRDFEIDLTGSTSSGGEQNTITFENLGNQETVSGGRTLISTLVAISII